MKELTFHIVGPLFSIDSNDRLDHTDATHVEMLATDTEFLGFLRPLGHGNFRPISLAQKIFLLLLLYPISKLLRKLGL